MTDHFHYTGDKAHELMMAMALAMVNGYTENGPPREEKIWGWREEKESLILCFYKTEKSTPFLGSPNSSQISVMISDWLLVQNYGPSPDTDGSTSKGFEILSDGWRQITIKPHSIIYGK